MAYLEAPGRRMGVLAEGHEVARIMVLCAAEMKRRSLNVTGSAVTH